jgi:hypothetical protein
MEAARLSETSISSNMSQKAEMYLLPWEPFISNICNLNSIQIYLPLQNIEKHFLSISAINVVTMSTDRGRLSYHSKVQYIAFGRKQKALLESKLVIPFPIYPAPSLHFCACCDV